MIATLSRIWLTRSLKPFRFTNDYDRKLHYINSSNLGLYVHIPFCKSICNFCPYCKEIYTKEKCDRYIDSLIDEINYVCGDTKEKKKITSLYFGGGTPALAVDRLNDIIEVLNKYFEITDGIGVELHPENVCDSTLSILRKIGVTKISIGIQSFQDKFLDILGRGKFDYSNMLNSLKKYKFDTVSMDFIFALPDQTIDDLKKDIEMAFSNGANHIAVYPFIDFDFTKSNVKAMTKREKRKLLDEITLYCEKKGYHRDSIWTFAKEKNAKYSSMTRDNFLGFGCSATTVLDEQFKINTFSVEDYINRIADKDMATSLTIRFTKRQRMLYYLFWTAYTTRINKKNFESFFGVSLKRMYGFELLIGKMVGFFTEDDDEYKMTLKGAFYYHHYENYYTLAYIDKMWGIMRDVAFPEKIEL